MFNVKVINNELEEDNGDEQKEEEYRKKYQ